MGVKKSSTQEFDEDVKDLTGCDEEEDDTTTTQSTEAAE